MRRTVAGALPPQGLQHHGRRLHQTLANHEATLTWDAHAQASAKASEVREAITRKSERFGSRRFVRHQRNWLLVIDKLPFLFMDLELFSRQLRVDYCPVDSVFFMTEKQMKRERYVVLMEVGTSGTKVLGMLPATGHGEHTL